MKIVVATVTLGLAASAAILPGAHAMSAGAPALYFKASPVSGPAPLTVAFCASAGIAINFGDGMSSGMGVAPDGACPTAGANYVMHTYTTPGIYKLGGMPCPGVHAEVCGGVAQQANAITITVTPRQ